MTLSKRLGILEAKTPPASAKVHRVVIKKAGSLDDALDAYGRDKISPGDRIIARRIVGPPKLEVVA